MKQIGVLFANLGTPQAPQAGPVGRYLKEFLMDPYVIQIPLPFRWLLVKGIIAPFRAKKSALNYKKVWTPEGSPLLVETKRAVLSLSKVLGPDYKVVVGMRYGEPSFKQAKEELKNCQKIIFFPQYPQYAESTVQTSLRHFKKYFSEQKIETIPPYFNNPFFIQSYVDFLEKHLKEVEWDHLLMSFHGLPESHLYKTDPSGEHCLRSENCCEKASSQVLKTCYRAQCMVSGHQLASGLKLSRSQYTISFQSRLGRQKWIEPYTEEVYQKLVDRGVKKLAVACPGFPVDGLETLEEIAMTGRKTFLSAGGESFSYIPCLNSDPGWIAACSKIIKKT